ncbi:MAG: HD domain-containing protein [Nanoarchaeota archaeon]
MKAITSTKGRARKEREDVLAKDPFLNDYIKITQSGAYRRLAYKTQVLSMPNNPHVRTRLVHTEEVIGISMILAESLGLNMNLCMAIAAGHDIGHTPYGHLGERVLSRLSGRKFKHNINSVLIAKSVERKGKGLNLTEEVLEGMFYHSLRYKNRNKKRANEYSAVMWADKIAYTFSDLNDGLRYGYLKKNEIPSVAFRLGKNQRERTATIVNSILKESRKKGLVSFSEGKVYRDFMELREFLKNNFYKNIDLSLQERYLKHVYRFIKDSNQFDGIDPLLAVSLLTDREVDIFIELITHSVKPGISDLKHFGLMEILPYIKDTAYKWRSTPLKKQ